MTINKLLAVILMTAAVTCSGQNAPLEVKGVRLGAPANEVEKRFSWRGTQPLSCVTQCMVFSPMERAQVGCDAGMPDCISKDDVMFGPAAPAYYFFALDNGKVGMAEVGIRTDDFEPLLRALVVKYGKPSKEVTETMTNLMGAKIPTRTVIWTHPEGGMILIERNKSFTEGKFVMTTKENVSKVLQQQLDKAKSDAGKL